MQEIIIDEEFRFLLPTLDEETFRLLEENILEHGCLVPLVLWNGILIDGFNRYKICTHHNIPFDTVEMEFDSREEVLIWIISNQISRRNLTPLQLAHFRGIHYKADRKIQGDIYHNMLQKSQNGTFISGSTASRLAEEYNVSRNTILRNAKLAEGINAIGEMSPDVKRKILAGDLRIGKNRLEALASATTEEIGAVVAEMEEGTFQGRAQRNSRLTDAELASDSILPEIRQLNKVIRNFANDFTSMFRQLSDGGSVEMKTVLRSYIDQLEDLYRNL